MDSHSPWSTPCSETHPPISVEFNPPEDSSYNVADLVDYIQELN